MKVFQILCCNAGHASRFAMCVEPQHRLDGFTVSPCPGCSSVGPAVPIDARTPRVVRTPASPEALPVCDCVPLSLLVSIWPLRKWGPCARLQSSSADIFSSLLGTAKQHQKFQHEAYFCTGYVLHYVRAESMGAVLFMDKGPPLGPGQGGPAGQNNLWRVQGRGRGPSFVSSKKVNCSFLWIFLLSHSLISRSRFKLVVETRDSESGSHGPALRWWSHLHTDSDSLDLDLTANVHTTMPSGWQPPCRLLREIHLTSTAKQISVGLHKTGCSTYSEVNRFISRASCPV